VPRAATNRNYSTRTGRFLPTRIACSHWPHHCALLTHVSYCTQAEVGKIADTGQIVAVDPEARMIVLRIYEGKLMVIPIRPDRKLGVAFDIRCGAPFSSFAFSLAHECHRHSSLACSICPYPALIVAVVLCRAISYLP